MQIFDFQNHFLITIEMNHWHRRNMAAIKAIPGNRWIPLQKSWWVPGTEREKIEALKYSHRAEIKPGTAANVVEIVDFEPMRELTVTPPLHNIILRHYQGQGVAQGMHLERFMNGDDMGLGKTIQSIATAVTLKMLGAEVMPVLVVCPSSLKENWKLEIEKFSNSHALILTDKVAQNWPNYFKLGLADFYITNFESLKKYFVRKWPTKKDATSGDIEMNLTVDLFKALIIDESQRVKDTKTQQTKICLRLAHKKKYVILLSGTPVVNTPKDLWAPICIMGHKDKFAPSEKVFKDKFCKGGRGVSNAQALNSMLNKYCFFRREKKDVAKELPPKSRQKLLCEITTRAEYSNAYANFANWLAAQDMDDAQVIKSLKAEALVRMNALRQISARGKIFAAKEYIDEVHEGGNKLIVFAIHHVIIDELKKLYPAALTITGRDDTASRQRNVVAFQTDPACNLIICNIGAGGVGITLTAASRVLMLEYPWTYSGCVQCEDRAYRIGQTLPVLCTYLLGIKTIDEDLLEIILAKKDLAQSITGSTDDMEMSVMDGILSLFNQRK